MGKLVKRKGRLVQRSNHPNAQVKEKIDELVNRVDEKVGGNFGDFGKVFSALREIVDESKEEKNPALDVKEDKSKRIITLPDEKVIVTPKAYVSEKPVPRYKAIGYRDGGEGFIKWVDDFVYAPIYPPGSAVAEWIPISNLPTQINKETGKSYMMMWWTQQEIAREALKMVDQRFIHRLIAFCWQRGEGKSFIACLIQLWKFFNWPRQQIMLGANSKDQVKFVHFDIMRDLIYNSPGLLERVGGKKNIQEKEIRLKTADGNVRSLVRSISSFSGIVSNITGYTFSEIFDMKKPKFFVQLDGSIRNMPNAFGVIDSTVSDKTHVLYQLYRNYEESKTKTVFFNYRCSRNGDPEDYMNPYMTRGQLEDYRAKFPFGEFERYFLNTWEAGRTQLFPQPVIEALDVIGIDGGFMNMDTVMKEMERKIELQKISKDHQKKGLESDYPIQRIMEIDNRCIYLSEHVNLKNNEMMTFAHLEKITDIFDTEWVILAGVDLGDPLSIRGQARSILSLNAKGLVGSRSNPLAAQLAQAAPRWLYVKIGLFDVERHSLDNIKEILDFANDEFDGIDVLACERYGAWDVAKWCEDRDIDFEPVYPNYERQKVAFKELYLALKDGRMKCTRVPIRGSKEHDIYREELKVFDHDLEKKAFGSPEKFEKGGIQDDTIYADAWCLYGGRDKGVDDFRIRRNVVNFGSSYADNSLIAQY